MGVVTGGGGGAAFPAQWSVDAATGALTLGLTLPLDGHAHDAFVVTLNSTTVFRAYLASDGTPLVTVTDLQLGSIWRDEVNDVHPTIQVLADGLIRSQDLPTVNPAEIGDLWVDIAAGRVVKSSGG